MADKWANEFYSQFGEDGILYGYFRSKEYSKSRRLDYIEPGFFVDIGAHHPTIISNTWFLYQRGWRGINVDPTPGTMDVFAKVRPEDVNLEIAITDTDGEATFYTYGEGGVQNTMDAARVDKSRNPTAHKVKTMRLSTLLDRYLPAGAKMDLLSVDVEGLDLKVLQSSDWKKYRPEIVIAEHHGKSIHEIIGSDICAAMTLWGYRLFAWTQPSLIFQRAT